MLLSSLFETTDAALFGAVVQGDVTDDGAPVGCEVLAMALELHRLGADVAAGMVLVAASTIKFNRITSAFTAGAGYAHVHGFLYNPGA